MRMVDIIAKKRDGHILSKEEIQWFVEGYTNDDIPDYQASAFAMALYFQGMTQEEAAALTFAMAASGDQLDLSKVEGVKVDKHSTGGVGDKTTLILGPLVASIGVPVAKMSGRGLGHTGGTIDKLESFQGLKTELSQQEFIRLVNENKIAVAGQSGNLTPADKKLYALRDVTATVDSIPLIASSVMSKKIAAGADAIVLDVKAGSGAFMDNVQDAKKLAEAMVRIGNSLDRKTMAIISNMDEPLGRYVGNALEVKEAVETLKGNGPKDLHELSVTLAAHMAVSAGKAANEKEAGRMLEKVIADGSAVQKMKQFVQSQGGDASAVDHPEMLQTAAVKQDVTADKAGYVQAIHAADIGKAAMMLGAGRTTKEDVIDHTAGIELHKKVGSHVEKNETIATLYTSNKETAAVEQMVQNAYTIGENSITAPTLIYDTIR
ncbi:thymidine phosphorylase [Alteribacillus persepolensis]|uniref:Pyrimidine-nucleoside phosphorylase n=1 Tax=Alteribacillus persepolensis TaxID=568899 RepID=A0A1G7ZPB5_9BACI|nr:pyrimidine-nucleoside phosphorylase [Alteribacillus persepolensis]SDH10386.1 thymidine phosphorylase [Alteribacillus persepolensis]